MESTISTEGRPIRGGRIAATPSALVLAALVLASCASGPAQTGFVAPLERIEISSEFGERRGAKRRKHYGVDLRAPRGTPVAAVARGRVIFRGTKRGFGRLVIVDHGGRTVTYYAHLSDFAVGNGEGVGPGQTVGFVGQSGNATGPHLHFELREDGKPVDPRPRIGF